MSPSVPVKNSQGDEGSYWVGGLSVDMPKVQGDELNAAESNIGAGGGVMPGSWLNTVTSCRHSSMEHIVRVLHEDVGGLVM